jgi:hypothetical protein
VNINYVSIDITRIPFSRYGAYVSVTAKEGKSALTVHNVRKRFQEGPAFEVLPLRDGRAVDCKISASPSAVVCTAPEGKLRIYIRDDETLVFDSENLDLYFRSLVGYSYGSEAGEGKFRVILAGSKDYAFFSVPRGSAGMCGPYTVEHIHEWNGYPVNKKADLLVSCNDGKALAALKISMVEAEEIQGPVLPDQETEIIQKEWESFLSKMPVTTGSDEEKEFARLTWYNLWSSFVRARDVYHYDTMLMSKKTMSSVWSWDHCFNALAMAGVGSREALEQFLAPFVLQAPNGALPDMWNPNAEIVWGVTKPPIHGWCFGKLMDKFEYPEETLKEVYKYLEKWTGWWFSFRDEDHDGIPSYPQGCDSGWDNSTVFDNGYFVESPDLSAFLVLQMNTLARIAEKLEDAANVSRWKEKAGELLSGMLAHFWKGDQFVPVLSHSHAFRPDPSSLLSHIPVALGNLLDKDKLDSIAGIIEKRFLTEHGLATEAPDSPRYESDGYWRGPIWAPSTYLIVDGLRRGGHARLAEIIARRYLNMSCYIAKGNYENFDALTGMGLRAPGYTWSASVYMLLSWEYPA